MSISNEEQYDRTIYHGYLMCGNSYFKNGLCYCKISNNLIKNKCICLIEFVESCIGENK